MRTAEATQLAETRREPVAVEDAFALHYSAVFRQVQRLMRDPDDSYDLTLTAWEKAQRACERSSDWRRGARRAPAGLPRPV